MPTYKLPKPKKKSSPDSDVPVCDDGWRRRVNCIPANEEIVQDLAVGDEYIIVLKGTVTGADLHKRDGDDISGGLDIDVDSVSVHSSDDNEFSKLVDDE